MKEYYVIRNLRDNYYVCFEEESSDNIMSACEFESEQDAIQYANNHFDYYFTFTIEKVFQITK